MNRIRVVAIGKIKERYLTEGIQEYVKRLGPLCRLEIAEVSEEKMPEAPAPAEKTRVLAAEGDRLLKRVPAGSHLIVLDVAGQSVSSEDLARKISTLGTSGQGDITFLIGGAFGLSPAVLAAARERISLSRLTFTHQMVRLLILEQVYRAFKIIRGEPYHW